MFFVLATQMGGPDEFIEHCYEEQVIVDRKVAVTENPNSASQLQAAFCYILLGSFEKIKDAKKFKEEYIEHRDKLHIENDQTLEYSPVKIKESLDKKNDNWYGKGDIIIS